MTTIKDFLYEVGIWCEDNITDNCPIKAQDALNVIYYSLDCDKETIDYLRLIGESEEQLNSIKLHQILWKVSKKYRKEYKKWLKRK